MAKHKPPRPKKEKSRSRARGLYLSLVEGGNYYANQADEDALLALYNEGIKEGFRQAMEMK